MQKICFCLCLCLILWIRAEGQHNTSISESKHPYSNPVLLTHYSEAELGQLYLQDSLKYKTIVYYYTQSFIVEPVTCSECRPFDPQKFDVSEYERFRLQSARFTRSFYKYGFKLTLLSVDELEYKLPLHN